MAKIKLQDLKYKSMFNDNKHVGWMDFGEAKKNKIKLLRKPTKKKK